MRIMDFSVTSFAGRIFWGTLVGHDGAEAPYILY